VCGVDTWRKAAFSRLDCCAALPFQCFLLCAQVKEYVCVSVFDAMGAYDA